VAVANARLLVNLLARPVVVSQISNVKTLKKANKKMLKNYTA
jgi:hypothetical protein